MTYTITLPSLGKKLQTKDMILSLLSRDYPLTAKQITNRIKKDFGSSVTFPGVYKAINQLIESQVLQKNGQEIKISLQWIKNSKTFIDGLHKTYLKEIKSGERTFASENVQVYQVDNLIDLDKFWIKIFEEWFDDPKLKDDHLVQLCGHTWYILGQLENEEACLKNIKDHKLKFYTLVDSNTPLDKWASKYYTDWKFHYTTKKTSDISHHKHYYIVYADMIMESVYPEKLAKDLDTIYNTAKKIGDLDLKKFISILKRKEQLTITIMKNKPLADQLRKEVLSYF